MHSTFTFFIISDETSAEMFSIMTGKLNIEYEFYKYKLLKNIKQNLV